MSTSNQTNIPIPKVKRGLKSFFGDVVREMKKVNWPPHKETNRLTGVVLTVCGGIIALLVILNMVIGALFKFLTSGS